MWQKIKCFFGDLFKKDWHDWETFCFYCPKDKPNLAYENKKCKICGKIISVPIPKERVKR